MAEEQQPSDTPQLYVIAATILTGLLASGYYTTVKSSESASGYPATGVKLRDDDAVKDSILLAEKLAAALEGRT
jgi:hypothetical protein